MTYILPTELHKMPLYFVYRRTNTHTSTSSEKYRGTFHAHQGIEILFVHQGKGTLIVDQKSYELRAGLIGIFQPFQLHHIQVELTDETPFVRSIVHFEPSLFEAYFDKWPAMHAFFKHIHTSKLPHACRYMMQESIELEQLFTTMYHHIPQLSKKDYFEEFSLFLVSFFRVFKSLWEQDDSPSEPSETRQSHQAERILKWLDTHYKEPLRLEQMSADLHLSPYHLSHLFKECTGSSITDYIAARRMREAMLLLSSSEQSISQIGEEVGITNSSYFCKLFKSHMGVTPHQFRKNLRAYR
ncbi:AraC family transcriptional regulator [Paenibacillus hexagrammi]|uniref:AraC family transcriptional regulator n=1 Tax=Paenibacillus hexagrammi TaxID=2908839 RepID=A0ABY3SDN8_9BACL|nr:AraC family transcriptional regulator [Paenibacillus sp. YPD9-1]UJF31344.1 AraC family transcriptional regulator [Paenibacillus sp. YPD9-1]